MLASLIAERYAKALLRAAEAEKALPQVGEQADALRAALASAQGAQSFLGDPIAEPQEKLKVLTELFGAAVHPVFKAFLLAVLEQNREVFLPVILRAFCELRDGVEGRATVHYGTAHTLPAGDRKVLEETLGKRLGRTVILEPYTDPRIIGGAVLKIGDTVYDGSLRSRLDKLGRLLAEGPPPRPSRASSPSAGDAASAKTEIRRSPAKAEPAKAKARKSASAKAAPSKARAAASGNGPAATKAAPSAKTKVATRTGSKPAVRSAAKAAPKGAVKQVTKSKAPSTKAAGSKIKAAASSKAAGLKNRKSR
jgi:F-type H+-transporting ATPase subunit delta